MTMQSSDELLDLLARHSRHDLPVLYISGPMTGLIDFNFPAFNEFSRKMRYLGFPVLNPADFGAKPGLGWEECLARDISLIQHCDLVVLLDGWQLSKGAKLERHVAAELGKVVLDSREFVRNILLLFWEPDDIRHLMLLDEFRANTQLYDDGDVTGISVPSELSECSLFPMGATDAP